MDPFAAVQLHLQLAGQDEHVVDRVGAVHGGAIARGDVDDAQGAACRDARAGLDADLSPVVTLFDIGPLRLPQTCVTTSPLAGSSMRRSARPSALCPVTTRRIRVQASLFSSCYVRCCAILRQGVPARSIGLCNVARITGCRVRSAETKKPSRKDGSITGGAG